MSDHHFERFILRREEDETGISGIGVVAEGVRFSDGRCAMHWCSGNGPTSTVLYDSIEDLKRIHGHGGKTVVEWLERGDA